MKTTTYIHRYPTRRGAVMAANRVNREEKNQGDIPNRTARVSGPYSDGGWVCSITVDADTRGTQNSR